MSKKSILVEKTWEYINKDHLTKKSPLCVDPRSQGLYALFNQLRNNKFELVYVGMARRKKSGMLGRLFAHKRSPKKGKKWTHFSAYRFHRNINSIRRETLIEEMEGLLRHIYARVPKTLNRQIRYKPIKKTIVAKDDELTKLGKKLKHL